MPVIKTQAPEFTATVLYQTFAEMRHAVHPADQRDAFWVIHPAGWNQFASALTPAGQWTLQPEFTPAEMAPTVRDDLFRPDRLFGLPLHIRDDGQGAGEVAIWCENQIEAAIRRNPQARVNVMEPISLAVEQLPPPPPTLRALLRHWLKRKRGGAPGGGVEG